jgi:hypothetical protein
MDQETKAYLDEMKRELRADISGIETRFDRVETRFDQVETCIDQTATVLRADIERVETALLTEFHKWASPVEMRARSHAAAIRALDIEVESLAERVTKLDRPTA